ncbi:hypothetical protein ACFXOY_18090 [Streptomyces niveus]|uniref:hypothetical protein n=1 Tax=Streptomyces niveus TaxID=193462 RepID=UPI0036CEDC1E
MICAICSEQATHYYRTAGGNNSGRCRYHAEQFGYPEYLVELVPPRTALRVPGYVILFNDGDGNEDEVAATWPFEEERAEWWVETVAACDAEAARWLVTDAAHDRYRPQYLEAVRVTVEVTRVTCLPLIVA